MKREEGQLSVKMAYFKVLFIMFLDCFNLFWLGL